MCRFETAGMATDHTATGVISKHTRGQHQVHAREFWGRQRATHIQGFRDTKDATQSRVLARKRGRKYAKQKKLLRLF